MLTKRQPLRTEHAAAHGCRTPRRARCGRLDKMTATEKAKWLDMKQALLQSYAVNERINHYLLENLDAAAWTADPPGGKGRTIAAIAMHMHNVRHMWLVAAAKGKPLPDKLDRATVTNIRRRPCRRSPKVRSAARSFWPNRSTTPKAK